MTIKQAAALLGKTEQFIRIGLQQKVLPFGSAVKMPGGRYSYYISDQKIKKYTGESNEETT